MTTPHRSKLGSRNKLIRAGKKLSLSKALPIAIILVTLTALGQSAETRASGGELVWQQPFQPGSASMPVHFGSGINIKMYVELSETLHDNTDGIDFYRKQASDSSWTEWESQNIQSQWKHGSSNNGDLNQFTYLIDKQSQELSFSDGESQTVTVDGVEVQITVSNIADSATVPYADIDIGGNSYNGVFVGQYVSVPNSDCYLRLEEVPGNAILQTYCSHESPSDGNYEYKAVVTKDNGDKVHSEPIYFDVSSSDGQNIPYIQEVRVGGKTVEPFQPVDNLYPGDVVEVDIVQQESDAYNATLQDRNAGINILRSEVLSDGSISSYTDQVLDQSLGLYFDVGSFQKQDVTTVPFKITPEQSDTIDFLDRVNGTYSLGFEISDTPRIRKSVDYTVTTNLDPSDPVIQSIEGSPDCNNYENITNFKSGSFECVKVTATDSDTDELYVSLNLTQEYDGIKHVVAEDIFNEYDYRNGDEYVFNLSKADVPINSVNGSGTWTASAYAGDALTNDTRTVSWDVPWGQLMVERVQPSSTPFSVLDNETFSNSYRISCGGGPECVNQNQSVELLWDPKPVDQFFEGLI